MADHINGIKESCAAAGTKDNSINGGYASYKCIKDFLAQRADHIQPMLDFVNQHFSK